MLNKPASGLVDGDGKNPSSTPKKTIRICLAFKIYFIFILFLLDLVQELGTGK